MTLPAAPAAPGTGPPPLVPAPGIAVLPASATADAKAFPPIPAPDPDALLQRKGLIRSGLVYVLPEEDSINKKYNELSRMFADWQGVLKEMNDGIVYLARLQDGLIALERRDKPSNTSITVVYVDATPSTDSKWNEAATGAKAKDSKADAKGKQKKKDGSTSTEEDDAYDSTGSQTQAQPPFPYPGRNGYPSPFDNRLNGPFPGTGGYVQTPGGLACPPESAADSPPRPARLLRSARMTGRARSSPVRQPPYPSPGRDFNIPRVSPPPQGTTRARSSRRDPST